MMEAKAKAKGNAAILREIARNLKAGRVYGIYRNSSSGQYWERVLGYDYGMSGGRERPMWFWCHYGSSANRATLRDLAWLLRVIFKLTPGEFVARYAMV
jgi:hypothetical protein